MDPKQTATLEDVRREIAEARAWQEREARAARQKRQWEREREIEDFRAKLVAHVICAVGAFGVCWLVCAMLVLAVAGEHPGPGAQALLSLVPFALWLAGAAVYARRAFGPKDDDGGGA